MDKIIIPLAFLLICVFISRMIGEFALRKLSDDEKVSLVDQFSGARMYMGLPLYILLFAFLVAMFYYPEKNMLWFGIFVAIFSVYQVGVVVWSVMLLRKIEISAQYIKNFVMARAIMLFGFFGMFGLLFFLSE